MNDINNDIATIKGEIKTLEKDIEDITFKGKFCYTRSPRNIIHAMENIIRIFILPQYHTDLVNRYGLRIPVIRNSTLEIKTMKYPKGTPENISKLFESLKFNLRKGSDTSLLQVFELFNVIFSAIAKKDELKFIFQDHRLFKIFTNIFKTTMINFINKYSIPYDSKIAVKKFEDHYNSLPIVKSVIKNTASPIAGTVAPSSSASAPKLPTSRSGSVSPLVSSTTTRNVPSPASPLPVSATTPLPASTAPVSPLASSTTTRNIPSNRPSPASPPISSGSSVSPSIRDRYLSRKQKQKLNTSFNLPPDVKLARVLYDYSPNTNDVNFQRYMKLDKGDIIQINKLGNPGEWSEGITTGGPPIRSGYFPTDYVEVISPSNPSKNIVRRSVPTTSTSVSASGGGGRTASIPSDGNPFAVPINTDPFANDPSDPYASYGGKKKKQTKKRKSKKRKTHKKRKIHKKRKTHNKRKN